MIEVNICISFVMAMTNLMPVVKKYYVDRVYLGISKTNVSDRVASHPG